MRNRTVALLVAATGLCLVPSTLATAQPSTSRASQPVASETGFDLDFAGGPLGDYLDAVADRGRANIVASDDVRALPMPSLRLRGVRPWAAVNMVQAVFASPQLGYVEITNVGDDPRNPPTNAEGALDRSASAPPIFVVSLRQARPAAEPVSVNEVFSVGDVLRPGNEEPVDLQIKRIFEMIDSAMALSPAPQEPELAFHDQTQMLVFRGSPEQRRLIESVLARYLSSWRPISGQAQSLRRQIQDLALEARTTSIEAESAEQRLQFAQSDVDRLRQLAATGNIPERDLHSAIAQASELEARVRILQAKAEHTHARIDDCVQSLAAITQGEQPSTVVYDFRGLGGRAEATALGFKAMLDAAQLPGTSFQPDGRGTVTLTARPPIHEAMRYLINHLRDSAGGGR